MEQRGVAAGNRIYRIGITHVAASVRCSLHVARTKYLPVGRTMYAYVPRVCTPTLI
jgi:hypothetical protein